MATEGDIQATPAAAPVPEQLAGDTSEVIAPEPSFSWQASEYVFHQKSVGWYAALWLLTAGLCAGLGLLHQWLSIAVVVVMALAVMVYSRKEPRTLTYALDDHGISIEGKISSYHLFKSYNTHAEVGWQEIDLEPARRFAPRLTILCEVSDFETIEDILSQHLPRVDRDFDWIERATRFIKF